VTHDSTRNTEPDAGSFRLWHLLLIIPFVALLWVPLYNSVEPAVFGIPFFYWYQFLWVIITSALIILVEAKTREGPLSGESSPAREPGERP